MGCVVLRGGIHTTQRQMTTQIPICFYVIVLVSASFSGSVNIIYADEYSL